MEEFAAAMEALGFRRVSSRRSAEWALQATRYLSFSVIVEGDGSAIVTWELAMGELMSARGLLVGTNDPLQIFAYPQGDARGPAQEAFVSGEVKRVMQTLSAIDLSGA